MKHQLFASVICFALLALSGCQKKIRKSENSLQPESIQPVRYQVAISRTTTVEMKKESGENNPQTMTEKLTAQLSLWPGRNMQDRIVFKAVCDSVHMQRFDFVGTSSDAEALRHLQGQEFTLAFSKEGKILDNSSLKKLMKPTVKESIRSCKGTFKEPDMLVDFYAVVTDLCATAAKENYSQGGKYTRLEPTPTPAVEFSLPDRKIACTVDQMVNRGGIRTATITEVHTLTEDSQPNLSGIYVEGIKTKGLFSSLRRWDWEGLHADSVVCGSSTITSCGRTTLPSARAWF